MRIFYINVIEQNAGWGAEFFVNRGLLADGHTTHTLDYRAHRADLIDRFAKAPPFDVLLLQRGDGFPLELLETVNRPCYFWASELISRCRDQDSLIQSGLFQHIFVRGEACRKQVVEKRWLEHDKVSILLSGFDELTQCKLPHEKKDIDVAFVGSMTDRRKRILDRLRRRFDIQTFHAFGKEMTRIFNRSKIILNIHAEDYLDTETRIFEALGCGAFVLTETLAEESPFISGIHLVEQPSLDALEESISRYLNSEGDRQEIADRGYLEAVTKHTYLLRSRHIVDVMRRLPAVQNQDLPAIDQDRLRRYRAKRFLYSSIRGTANFLRGVVKI